MNDLDNKQQEVINKVKFEADRVGQIVSDLNTVKADLHTVFADMRSNRNSLFEETKAFATKTDETAGGTEATINELHEKTKLFADQTIAEIANIKSNLATEIKFSFHHVSRSFFFFI